jgi:membrane protein implicated in regulation of membrane protease activity
MVVDFLTMYAWIFWVALLLLFVIVEVITSISTFLMLAVDASAVSSQDSLRCAVLGADPVARVLALLLLFARCVRRLKRSLGRGPTQPRQCRRLLGRWTVTTPFVDGQGLVKLANGRDLDGSSVAGQHHSTGRYRWNASS